MVRKVIISGGGTGGHIFPAVAIANEIQLRYPNAEILFVGALGKMEMEKVPQAGYKIIGLPIAGLQRRFTLSNFLLPFKVLSSVMKALKIVNEFKPDVVIGVGGYASSAIVFAASVKRIPILIQEQNSYAGLTNKFLANKAKCVCVAYPNMQTYFQNTPIVLTGNPVRETIYKALTASKTEAKTALGFDPQKPVCLIIGGSLGARTINQAIQAHVQLLHDNGIQLLWQTGQNFTANIDGLKGIQAKAFIQDMATAYAAADMVVSRAGALSISELSLLSKPSILVPSPNVAEDHQTKNAMALSQVQAAVLVKDQNAMAGLHTQMLNLLNDPEALSQLSHNIAAFSKPNAIKDIVTQIEQII